LHTSLRGEKRLRNDKIILEKKLMQGEEELMARKNEIEEQQKMLAEKERSEYEIRWYNDGLAKFSEVFSNEKNDLGNLCQHFISKLIAYIEAIQGGIYTVNNDNRDDLFVELAASHSYNREKNEKKRYSPGEGLVGACFQSQEIIEIRDVPDTYLKIESGLGGQKPGYLLLLPVKNNTDVEGVIEIASFQPIEPYRIRFIEKLVEMLVPIISSIKSNSLFGNVCRTRNNRRNSRRRRKSSANGRDERLPGGIRKNKNRRGTDRNTETGKRKIAVQFHPKRKN
jgi:hypothetical protein